MSLWTGISPAPSSSSKDLLNLWILVLDFFHLSVCLCSLPSGFHIIIRTSRQGHRCWLSRSQGALRHVIVATGPKHLSAPSVSPVSVQCVCCGVPSLQETLHDPSDRAFPHNLKDSKPDSAANFRRDIPKWYDLRKCVHRVHHLCLELKRRWHLRELAGTIRNKCNSPSRRIYRITRSSRLSWRQVDDKVRESDHWSPSELRDSCLPKPTPAHSRIAASCQKRNFWQLQSFQHYSFFILFMLIDFLMHWNPSIQSIQSIQLIGHVLRFTNTMASWHPNSLCLKIVLHHTQDFWRCYRITGWPRKTSKALHKCNFCCESFWDTAIFANAFAVLRFMFIIKGMLCLLYVFNCFHYLLYVSLPCFCNFFFLRPQQLHEVLGTIFTLILRSLLCYSELRLLNAQDARDDWISREMRVRVMHVVPRCLSKNVNHLLLRSGTKSRLLRE